VCLAAALCAGPMAAGVVRADKPEEAAKRTVKDLPEHWRAWIEDEVYPLINKEQKKAFIALETEAQRKAFAERLWILWGRQTGFGSAFRTMYADRLAFAKNEFGDTFQDRARVLLIHGPPSLRMVSRCPEFFNPLEIWAWPYIEGLGESVIVVFYQSGGMGNFRMWYGNDGRRALRATMMSAETRGYSLGSSRFDTPRYRCPDGDALMNMLNTAELWARDPSYLQAMTEFRPTRVQGPKEESASNRFMEFSALVDKKAEPLTFTLSDESCGDGVFGGRGEGESGEHSGGRCGCCPARCGG